MNRFQTTLATLALAGLATTAAHADENYFGYTYGAEVLPQGKAEVYQWVTGRFGKADGNYAAYDIQTEGEIGFGNNWQGSLYVNQKVHDLSAVNSPSGANKTSWNFDGLAAEFKYQAMNPITDTFGLAFMFEPAFHRVNKHDGTMGTEIELETKVVFQKNFLDNKLIYAANLTPELEFERETNGATGEREFIVNMPIEFSQGITYRVASGLFVGLENKFNTELEGLERFGALTVWAGPAIHYARADSGWWGTLTVLPQIYATPSDTGSLDLADNERLQVRLKVGYNF